MEAEASEMCGPQLSIDRFLGFAIANQCFISLGHFEPSTTEVK